MDPTQIPSFIAPILTGEADYAKGNRFFELESLTTMPIVRLLGNAGLSFLAKFSTGYWQTFDPTNGYFAIHASLLPLLPIQKISRRYFFESDLLFRLNLLSAVLVDVPMIARYGDEKSNMNPLVELPRFALGHLINFWKRIFYNYFLRNFSLASIELVLGCAFNLFGLVYGVINWRSDVRASAGTVMLAALPIILGMQLLLAFINYDIQSVPRSTLHVKLKRSRARREGLESDTTV